MTPARLQKYNDLYNARRFAEEYQERLLYCADIGGWHEYDGRRYRRTENRAEQVYAGDLAAVFLAEADRRLSPARQKAAEAAEAASASPQNEELLDAKKQAETGLKVASEEGKKAKQAQTRRGIEAMLSLARSEPGLAVAVENVDSDPWMLNCQNGMLDLRNERLHPHSPLNRLTKVAGCQFDPSAKSVLWDSFLERILPDPAVRGFVQRLIGYALTGVIRDQVLPIFHGIGANGKSVLVGAVQAVLGDYSGTLPTEVLVPPRNSEPHPTGRAHLRGLRLAVAGESDRSAKLAVATVKALTGGDRIVARMMRQDFFEFDPTHKLVLVTNHKPIVSDSGDAIWRRVILVPFEVQIPTDEQDRRLLGRLRHDAAAILAWAVHGCREWQDKGLDPPQRILAATADYRASEDLLGEFIADKIVLEPQALSDGKPIHAEYEEWAESMGAQKLSHAAFYRMLEERGFRRGTRGNNGVRFHGLRVRTPIEAACSETVHPQEGAPDGGGDESDAMTDLPGYPTPESAVEESIPCGNGKFRHSSTSDTEGGAQSLRWEEGEL